VIHAYGSPDPPAPRLLAALAGHGHTVTPATPADARPSSILVLAAGATLDPLALGVLLGAWRYAPAARVLVLSRLGAHPDARAKGLRQLWNLEENARATGLPTLTLRLAPLLGPATPLWNQLRRQPRLGREKEWVIQPVVETDVVSALARLFSGKVPWEGWYEVAGREAFTLGELAALAARAGAPDVTSPAAWEPALPEIGEQRLAESGPWLEAFGVAARPLADRIADWGA
jgi:uncharacterized protein YbjT (DUF2867 family)